MQCEISKILWFLTEILNKASTSIYKTCSKMYNIYINLHCIPDKLLFYCRKHRSFPAISRKVCLKSIADKDIM